ncbi:MaoC/PaaZ C-terminal domain-containing protein [Cytobacillus purgationiresistens]|uniref:3-hydroxybutyryl-CoA dehydratase n=1 Tax=Cytobacillus purgationiresistens TaxID=863449 RepID=A0ABU0APN6_9BACI|nr:MaoC/PaaZ C-terminal domain-containing protein [Cytobacillus purgationiresistens]MDQ0273249.1 3-hydroxybutyryl-CoA dehydratase [Cytobacillus purgationiresistens]
MGYLLTELSIGQTAQLQRTFTEADVLACQVLTHDYSPVYNPDEEVWRVNYERPIVPGLLAEGLIHQVVSEKLPGAACILLQKEVIFYHPVYTNDKITAELEVIDINKERSWVTQKVTCFNQVGNEVIRGQIVLFVLPKED